MSLLDEDSPLKYSKKKRKQVNLEEEAEARRKKEYEENLEAKKGLIRKEFEKNQKEIMINFSNMSRLNEARLRKEFDELAAVNEGKMKHLSNLYEQLSNTEMASELAGSYTKFANGYSRNQKFDPSGSLGFHAIQMSSEQLKKISCTHFTISEVIKPENLYERIVNLKETLSEIEMQIDTEKETTNGINNKLNELTKDNNLLNKRNQELKKINEHAEKRFQNMQKIELVARSKYKATMDDINRRSVTLDHFRKKEQEYMFSHRHAADTEYNRLMNLQSRMSETLIAIEDYKKKNEEYEQKLEELDRYHEIMIDKRVNSKLVYKYVDILLDLEKYIMGIPEESPTPLLPPALKATRHASLNPSTRKSQSPSSIQRKSFYTFTLIPTRPTQTESPKLNLKPRNSLDMTIDNSQPKSLYIKPATSEKHHFIQKIYRFYELHPNGPDKFADGIISKYQDLMFQDMSLKNIYEDMANQKMNKEKILSELLKELSQLKEKNKSQDETEIIVDDKDTKEAIDSGIIVINNDISTINQVDIGIHNINDLKNLLAGTETFIFRIYLDFIDLLIRLSKYMQAISDQSGGSVPIDLEKLCLDIIAFTNNFSRTKKIKEKHNESILQNRPETLSSMASDGPTIHIESHNIDTNEIIQIFIQSLMNSDKPNGKKIKNEKEIRQFAEEFGSLVRQDSFVMTFLSSDNFKIYFLNKLAEVINKDEGVKAIFENSYELREEGIKIMMTYLQTMMKFYVDFIQKTIMYCDECTTYFKKKQYAIEIDPEIIVNKFEFTDHVRKINNQKGEILQLENLDTIRTKNSKKEADSLAKKPNQDDDVQNLDVSNIKNKICEIADVEFKKSRGIFKHENHNKNNQANVRNNGAQVYEDEVSSDIDEQEILDDERKRIKEDTYGKPDSANETITKKHKGEEENKRLLKLDDNQEIKKMIHNSKILQKIAFLEKQQSLADGKAALKSTFIENYIPPIVKPTASPKSQRNLRKKLDLKVGNCDSNPITPNKSTFFIKNRNESHSQVIYQKKRSLSKQELRGSSSTKDISELQQQQQKALKKEKKQGQKDLSISISQNLAIPKLKRVSTSTNIRGTSFFGESLPIIQIDSSRVANKNNKSKSKPKKIANSQNSSLEIPDIPSFFATNYNADNLPFYNYKFDSFKTNLKSLLIQKPNKQYSNLEN